jgi:hypothetical protein
MTSWKRLTLICLSLGAGAAIAVMSVIGGIYWYTSRPKPWNATAILAEGPPGFFPSDSGDHLLLRYTLINSTLRDYELTSQDQIKAVMVKMNDGSLILDNSLCQLPIPMFVPARQRTNVDITLLQFVLPRQNVGEADQDYHERVRQQLESDYGSIREIIIYDETRHYQITLPKWRSKKAK